MNENEAKAILSTLSPEVLAERQRIVDVAVREARSSGYCDTFNTLMRRIMPEMMVSIGGSRYVLDSEGRACGQDPDDRRNAWDWYAGNSQPDNGGPMYDANGYDAAGYDRDGFNRTGYDREGFDAQDRGTAYQRLSRRTRWVDEYGIEQTRNETVFVTGYGRNTQRDAEGNLRIGRGPTDEEAAAEAVAEAERAALLAARFNPTTFKPEVPAQVDVTA